MTTIRPATHDDALGIARVHVSSWHTSYAGILPNDILKRLTVYRRVKTWQGVLENDDRRQIVQVATQKNQIVGFVYGGTARDDFDAYPAELYAMYLLEGIQGQGIGRQLLTHFAQALHAQDDEAFYLWVLHANESARGFYAHLGGEVIGEKPVQMGKDEFIEVAIGWSDVSQLLASNNA